MDDLGLVETVDRLGESIVITVADAAHRRLHARLQQQLGILHRDVLGGIKRSSQRACWPIGEVRQVPLRACRSELAKPMVSAIVKVIMVQFTHGTKHWPNSQS